MLRLSVRGRIRRSWMRCIIITMCMGARRTGRIFPHSLVRLFFIPPLPFSLFNSVCIFRASPLLITGTTHRCQFLQLPEDGHSLPAEELDEHARDEWDVQIFVERMWEKVGKACTLYTVVDAYIHRAPRLNRYQRYLSLIYPSVCPFRTPSPSFDSYLSRRQ